MPRPTDDAELVARSRDGDTEAFRQLFERKHRRIYLIAYQVLGDAAQAEDVVQEVFLRLWERCGDFDSTLPLDPWLRRIASNRAIDHWRARNAERAHRAEAPRRADDADPLDAAAPSRDASADPTARLSWRELQSVWDEVAAELPPQQRAAFVLRHIEELEPAEVAAALGCSPSTVRSHVAEARRTLRAVLRARYPELLGGARADPRGTGRA